MNKNFFMISNTIFEYGLTPSEFIVFAYLVKCSDKSKTCFPSRETIARNCKMCVKTVDTALKTLIAEGLVEKMHNYKPDNSNSSNFYIVDNLLK